MLECHYSQRYIACIVNNITIIHVSAGGKLSITGTESFLIPNVNYLMTEVFRNADFKIAKINQLLIKLFCSSKPKIYSIFILRIW